MISRRSFLTVLAGIGAALCCGWKRKAAGELVCIDSPLQPLKLLGVTQHRIGDTTLFRYEYGPRDAVDDMPLVTYHDGAIYEADTRLDPTTMTPEQTRRYSIDRNAKQTSWWSTPNNEA